MLCYFRLQVNKGLCAKNMLKQISKTIIGLPFMIKPINHSMYALIEFIFLVWGKMIKSIFKLFIREINFKSYILFQ